MTFVSASAAIAGVAITDPGVGNNGSVTWPVAAGDELAPDATTTFTLVTKVSDVTASPIKNVAEITADSGDDEDSTENNGSGATDASDDTDTAMTDDAEVGGEDDSDFATLSADPVYDLALIKALTGQTLSLIHI